MSGLQGKTQLQARLKALKLSFKPIGKLWGLEDVRQMRPRVPSRTGKTRASFRVTSATQTRTRVGGWYVAYFIDKGPKAHVIRPKRGRLLKFQGSERTVFARAVHHRGYRGRPFRKRSAQEALRLTPMAGEVIKQWNSAKGSR